MNKIILSFFLVNTFLLAGCGQSFIEKQTERGLEQISGKETDVKMENGNLTIKDESGLIIESDTKGMSVPAEFPKDIYIIDGEVTAVIKNQMGQGSISISLSTKKNIKESFEIYKEKISEQGWKIEEAIIGQDAGEEMAMITAGKGNKGFLVSISKNPEEKNGALVILNVHEM